MKERRKSKPDDEHIAYDESADQVERDAAISRLTVDRFYEIEPLLAQLLRHESYVLRSRAVKSLVGFWGKSKYLDDAIKLLHSDPEWEVRGDAAFALSQFTSRAGEQKDRVVRELMKRLLQDDDFGVHEECYRGLLQLLAPEQSLTNLPTYFNRERDVDWELLKPYMDATKMTQS